MLSCLNFAPNAHPDSCLPKESHAPWGPLEFIQYLPLLHWQEAVQQSLTNFSRQQNAVPCFWRRESTMQEKSKLLQVNNNKQRNKIHPCWKKTTPQLRVVTASFLRFRSAPPPLLPSSPHRQKLCSWVGGWGTRGREVGEQEGRRSGNKRPGGQGTRGREVGEQEAGRSGNKRAGGRGTKLGNSVLLRFCCPYVNNVMSKHETTRHGCVKLWHLFLPKCIDCN